MKFVVIFGPPAVGKMTVGQELAKLTGLKLFHNHMTIELVLNFFDLMIRGLGNWFRNFAKEFSKKSQPVSYQVLFLPTSGHWISNLTKTLSIAVVTSFVKKAAKFTSSNWQQSCRND